MAAVRGDSGAALVADRHDLDVRLDQLEDFARGLRCLLGHNLIAFDLPHLRAARPDLAILDWPAIDTLRLNPLAFPRNPYHRLVKHYQDGKLLRGRLNDPELDARLALEVFADQQAAFQKLAMDDPDLLLILHWLTTLDAGSAALDGWFSQIRQAARPEDTTAIASARQFLLPRCCRTATHQALAKPREHAWPLAYVLAWLSVSGGNSVLPPWVRHQFPEAGHWLRRLRDQACQDPECRWCRQRHDPRTELKRWFGFDDFRPEPSDAEGRSLQAEIVAAAMRGEHVLGVLPTGTGKSLCYQIPALSRYDKTGALTLVISPLVALMADQVAGLEARGITACAALNGLLSMPERADVLDRVRLGDIGILIVSPEQLRSSRFRKVLKQREIGAWVLDEAHCISKWGHDFRPDYRYVGRFIREWPNSGAVAPVLCLTATAKPEVIADIRGHFGDKLGIELGLFDGGANRTNLNFDVVPTTGATKFDDIQSLLERHLPQDQPGGAIVYCARRAHTEEIAEFLREKGLTAEHFHAGLAPERKKTTQQRFISGELRVITATNAFGMGIDKPDVRLVIHADIPGSLENYLQEAGRAGRDRASAHCVLLYASDDVEQQFSMAARSRLSRRDITAILKSLRRLDRRKHADEDLVATSGEILAEDQEGVFQRDSASDDTRVRTALLWLEESALLTREENRVQVFPSSLRISTVDQLEQRLSKAELTPDYRKQLADMVECLIDADADQGVSTDELMGAAGLNAEGVRKALYDLEQLGIASNDTALTAFVHQGVSQSSTRRLAAAQALEVALIDLLRELAPELGKGDGSVFHLRQVTQRLKDDGHANALPERVWRLLRGLAKDGQGEAEGVGSLRLKNFGNESVQVTLQRDWRNLAATAERRRAGAATLLQHLLAGLPSGARGNDLLAETTLGRLRQAIDADLALRGMHIRDPAKLIDHALLWLHEQEVIRLNKGMAVFRPAMTIRLAKEKRGFLKADFVPLEHHYREQTLQIHVMAEYAQRALHAMADALRLAMDYFSQSQSDFMARWLPGREQELAMQTLPESWRQIVEALHNPVQQRIVADDREQTSVLVLAGPGSGKTRVLVHRIAYLVRVRREAPRGIVALAYNRHAALEIRRRLRDLIGDDAQGVGVLTCHALAMRLVGASLAGHENDPDGFDAILRRAIEVLGGDDLPPDEADAQRDRLLNGFRWILVDEYQDVGPLQYQLIGALAGRSQRDPEARLSLFAVGDDDQNIYAFNGASVEYIRRFEQDFRAQPAYLTDNYRSSGHIIAAANRLIESAAERMKAEHPIRLNAARRQDLPGGDWQERDPVARGRVQILPAGTDQISQAIAAMHEFERLATLDADWHWPQAAVIAREWRYLEPVRAYCELHGIPVRMADEQPPPIWRLRETRQLLTWLEQRESGLIRVAGIQDWLAGRGDNPQWGLLRELIEALALEVGEAELPVRHLHEWLSEWGRDFRHRPQGLLLLTAHRAKGLEFEHVLVLDGGWERQGRDEDPDAARRLYYVAMTRARQTLGLLRFDQAQPLLDGLNLTAEPFLQRNAGPSNGDRAGLHNRYLRPSLKEIDLGLPGRHPPSHPMHAAIARLQPGDKLRLRQQEERWLLLDGQGRCVGRLAKAFMPPADLQLLSAQVVAIVEWRKQDSPAEYQPWIHAETWEVVLPELVYG